MALVGCLSEDEVLRSRGGSGGGGPIGEEARRLDGLALWR